MTPIAWVAVALLVLVVLAYVADRILYRRRVLHFREQDSDDVSASTFPPGAEAKSLVPGDIVLTHGNNWSGKLIRFGQALRFKGDERKYAWWNHVAVVVDADGRIIEALGKGIRQRSIDVYKNTEYTVVDIGAVSHDREQVVQFAKSCVGWPYGWAVIVSIALALLTGAKFSFGIEGQLICSGLVARALERTSLIPTRTPSHMMPADIARLLGVTKPVGVARGTPPAPREGLVNDD